MKFASLVLSGLLLVVLAGCGSDGDSGRVNQLTQQLEQAATDLEAAEAARMAAEGERDTAQTTLQTTQGQLTTTQTELQQTETERDTAQDERDTAQQQRDAAQAEADAQRQAAEQRRLEEERAEAITRSFGLLEAMDPATRATGRGDTNIARQHAARVLNPPDGAEANATDPMDAAPRSPKITNLGTSSVRLGVIADGEFSSVGGIPSLSMGGSSLRSVRLERDDPDNKTQEMAFYTDFKPVNMRLLDAYDDERPADPDDTTQKLDVITLASTGTNEAMDINEKAGDPPTTAGVVDEERFFNSDMYEAQDMKLVLQPGVSRSRLPRTGTYTLAASDYSLSYEYEFDEGSTVDPNPDDDDHYDITIIRSFNATLRGVSGRIQYRYAEIDGVLERDGNNVITKGCQNRSGSLCRPDPGDADDRAIYTDIPTDMSFMITTASGEFERYAIAGTASAWTFRPNSAGARVWLDDGQYLYFGWWQETPDEADGVYDLHIIADGMGRWVTGNSLTAGTAVYTGPAVGKYVRTISAHDELDHAGERRRNAVEGIFTANARLEAEFTGSAGTVKGTIVNFMDGGTAIPGNWQVNLGEGDMGTTATAITFGGAGAALDLSGTPTAVIVQGGQTGALPSEAQTGQKTWAVMFIGDEDTAPLNGLTPPVASQPAAAVGKFDVGLEHVIHFSGAFGVAKN